mgnify:CR=1 FL=1
MLALLGVALAFAEQPPGAPRALLPSEATRGYSSVVLTWLPPSSYAGGGEGRVTAYELQVPARRRVAAGRPNGPDRPQRCTWLGSGNKMDPPGEVAGATAFSGCGG